MAVLSMYSLYNLLVVVANQVETGNSIEDSEYYITIVLPDDVLFRAALRAALSQLTFEDYWLEYGSITPQEASEYFSAKIYAAFTSISII